MFWKIKTCGQILAAKTPFGFALIYEGCYRWQVATVAISLASAAASRCRHRTTFYIFLHYCVPLSSFLLHAMSPTSAASPSPHRIPPPSLSLSQKMWNLSYFFISQNNISSSLLVKQILWFQLVQQISRMKPNFWFWLGVMYEDWLIYTHETANIGLRRMRPDYIFRSAVLWVTV